VKKTYKKSYDLIKIFTASYSYDNYRPTGAYIFTILYLYDCVRKGVIRAPN